MHAVEWTDAEQTVHSAIFAACHPESQFVVLSLLDVLALGDLCVEGLRGLFGVANRSPWGRVRVRSSLLRLGFQPHGSHPGGQENVTA